MTSKSEVVSKILDICSNGNLQLLQEILSGRSQNEILGLTNASARDTTPLINACMNRNIDVMCYLLDTCHVDIEKVGDVVVESEFVQGAPPLWCAAVLGDLPMVTALVKRGANVDHGTVSCSSPLRASSYGGFIDVVKYLVKQGGDIELGTRYGTTCLMIASYKNHVDLVKYFLKLGVDVNRRTMRDENALEFAAEANNMEIIKLLLKNGADANSINHRSLTPLTYIVERNDLSTVKLFLKYKARFEIGEKGASPLMKAAAERHESIVEYFISRPECSKLGAIEALELIGASVLCRTNDTEKAGAYWRRALTMRLNENIKKSYASNKPPKILTPRYLENMLQNDAKAYSIALDIYEQILGPINPGTVNGLRYRGAALADTGHFQEAYELWMHALTNLLTYDRLFYSHTSDMLLWFARVFNEIRDESSVSAFPTFSQVSLVIQCCVTEIKRCVQFLGPASKYEMLVFNSLPVIVLHLISIALSLIESTSLGPDSDEMSYLKKLVYELLRLSPRSKDAQSLMHIAVDNTASKIGKYQVRKFPDIHVAKLLLFCGADANATDTNKSTPLHVIASDVKTERNIWHDIILLLLKHDAHYDTRNNQGMTAKDLANKKDVEWDWCHVKLTTLQCLAATVIVRHSIPYKGTVTPDLEKFICMH
ncbi:protein fem-1 homolog C-like [Anneissia japonica]|uniref:protein fem-1 homolog C-like n=1 Tax=Anneissia japonica TaxID=1529436 RepID=UPI0014259622|nr:protein fem-1 homolog C-like [Anneissia japonica]